jgi:hypothetical protein
LFPLFLSLSFVSLKVWANLSHIGKKKTEKKKRKKKKEKEKGIMLCGGQPGRISERRHLLKMAKFFQLL